MNIRELAEIIGRVDATHTSAPQAVAQYIMDALEGPCEHDMHDVMRIADVLEAYTYACQDARLVILSDQKCLIDDHHNV